MTAPSGREIELNGLRSYVVDAGQGPAVLLHCFPRHLAPCGAIRSRH
jgi:hypothetical protein